MLFCDLENFRYSVQSCFNNQHVEINFNRFHKVLTDCIAERINAGMYHPRLVRAYLYTGEYTNAQIDQAKKHLSEIPYSIKQIKGKIATNEANLSNSQNQDKIKREIQNLKLRLPTEDRIENLKLEIDRAIKRQKAQKEFTASLNTVDFLELRTRPLKYSWKDYRFIQKGIDVQLAVDLVNFAHFDNFDAAIVCSGDLDLLESCKQIKSLGKMIILVSHSQQASPMMIKESDYYLNLKELGDNCLKEIVNIP